MIYTLESAFKKYIMESSKDFIYKKFEKKMDFDTFSTLIELDPTYRGDDEVGKYGEWIASLYIRDPKILDEDAPKLVEALEIFNKRKARIRIDGHENDINKYKSLNDLREVTTQYQNVTEKDIESKIKDYTYPDIELVYEDSYWKVYVPHSYEASKELGERTSWCTAYTNTDSYYRDYTRKNNLYVLISKTNKAKFQFYFGEGNQFKNAEDIELDLYDFFTSYGVEKMRGLVDYFRTITK